MISYEKLFTFLIIATLIITTACNSQKSRLASSPLLGKWKLIETLSDPGDGSGKWMPAETDSVRFVNFGTDGSVSGNALLGTTRFAYTDSTHIALTQTGNAKPISYKYKVSGKTMVLNPPCREACGMRYVRMK